MARTPAQPLLGPPTVGGMCQVELEGWSAQRPGSGVHGHSLVAEGGAQLHDEAILWDGGGRGVRFQR